MAYKPTDNYGVPSCSDHCDSLLKESIISLSSWKVSTWPENQQIVAMVVAKDPPLGQSGELESSVAFPILPSYTRA